MIACQREASLQPLPPPLDPHLSFWPLWEQYQAYLLSRCRNWMGGNLAHAEDALSQAMLKAWELWPKVFAELRNPRAWLIRLTHNHCVDLHRKFGRQAIATQDLEMVDVTPVIATSSVASPEENLLQAEFKQVLQTEIQGLPQSLQQPFADYYLREKTTQAIAQDLQISENNVYKRLQKAREHLRHRLDLYLNSNRYHHRSDSNPLEAVMPIIAVVATTHTYKITSQCLALQPQLWSPSTLQLGWS